MKIIDDLNSNPKPLEESNQSRSRYSGEELSSTKGVISKNLYIAKINQLTLEVETPVLNLSNEDLIHIKKPGT